MLGQRGPWATGAYVFAEDKPGRSLNILYSCILITVNTNKAVCASYHVPLGGHDPSELLASAIEGCPQEATEVLLALHAVLARRDSAHGSLIRHGIGSVQGEGGIYTWWFVRQTHGRMNIPPSGIGNSACMVVGTADETPGWPW